MLIWICDNENIYRTNIREYCCQYFVKKGETFDIEIFSSGEEVIAAQGIPDILFLDIDLDKMNGIEVKENLWLEGNHQSFIVYITNYEKYMQEAYDINVLGYLRKPVYYEAIEKMLEKAKERFTYTEYIYENDKIRISAQDILYIEASGAYTWIYPVKGNRIMERKELTDWEDALRFRGFYRIHHSYLINMAYIKRYSKSELELSTENVKLPIARRRYGDFDREYRKYRRCIEVEMRI
ncbi:MAG: LytTR family DNA-binding domain-containing protein [Lachnospiraceae bacterium]|nr:LytTR family DNA-binding domain-containing protein [Lachnospiraceae bacterium]